MKLKIWHLIGDKRAGGSNLLVNNLIASLEDKFSFSIVRLEEVKTQLNKEKPDLIIFHYPCAWRYLLPLKQLKKYCPIYICDHHYCQGFEQHQVSSKFRFHAMLKLAYGMGDRIISISQAQKQWIIENKLAKSEKITVITPASPLESLLKIPPKITGEKIILGAYGRFAPQKGFDLLLTAIKEISTSPQWENFELHLGGYGQDEELITSLAQGLPHLKLLGAIAHIDQFLSHCDVIIIPSRWEGWGLVALEAKASARAVVAFGVDGLVEQIENCGVLIPPNDVSALGEAILSLSTKPITQWGIQGRNSVINSWQNCVQTWETTLEK